MNSHRTWISLHVLLFVMLTISINESNQTVKYYDPDDEIEDDPNDNNFTLMEISPDMNNNSNDDDANNYKYNYNGTIEIGNRTTIFSKGSFNTTNKVQNITTTTTPASTTTTTTTEEYYKEYDEEEKQALAEYNEYHPTSYEPYGGITLLELYSIIVGCLLIMSFGIFIYKKQGLIMTWMEKFCENEEEEEFY